MSNKAAIPSWQRAHDATPSPPTTSKPESEQETQPESSPAPVPEEPTEVEAQVEEPARDNSSSKDSPQHGPQPEQTVLLDQAAKFLQDPAIRDAPREKKVAFLESKGVRTEEIEKLLGEAAQGEKSTAQPPQPPAPKPPARDIPPIVTYPEFLTTSTKPPPLMTRKRILNTAYITGGLMATMYGLSKFIIAPMTQTLAESRHDFASHTQERLTELNKRLTDVVTEDPAKRPAPKVADVVDDISEADSDPTELFHRDFGTQTTPSLSRRPSATSSSDNDSTPAAAHERRLKDMISHLKKLESIRTDDTTASDSLKARLSDLNTYLSEMSYQNSYYSGMGGLYSSSYGVSKTKDGKEDQIEVFKGDIRAVKGVLLSARNFPAGGPRAVSGAPAGRVGV